MKIIQKIRKVLRDWLIGDPLVEEERTLRRTAEIIALTEDVHAALERRLRKAGQIDSKEAQSIKAQVPAKKQGILFRGG